MYFFYYLIVVFLNAFTDLGHKIIIQNTIFKYYSSNEQIILTAIVNALILLPFIFLFSPSSFIASRYDKAKIMQYSAIFAIIITSLITFSYYQGLFWTSFILTFLLAAQSAIYSPAKYGYIKEIMPNNIIKGNSYVQSITIVAILGGIVFYSIMFEKFLDDFTTKEDILKQIAPLGFFLVFNSIIEAYFAFKLPKISKTNKKEFDINKYFSGKYLKDNLKFIKAKNEIKLSIIGLSIFWGLSQAILAIFPSFAKEYLHLTNAAIMQGLMGLSGIGIVIGSILSKKIDIKLILISSLFISILIFLIPFLNTLFIAIDFLLFGIFGGIIVVNLNSIIQQTTKEKYLGVILAGNNFIQNIFMVLFLLLTIFVSLFHLNSKNIFFLLSFISLIGVFMGLKIFAKEILTKTITFIIKKVYNLKSFGNIPNGGVLLLGNHISWLDWAFVAITANKEVRFVMEKSIYQKKAFKWFLDIFDVIPISSVGAKHSLEKVASLIKEGKVVCIFVEGTITRSGHLGEFKKGFSIVSSFLEENDGVIVPFYINGMWGRLFSRSNIKFKKTNSVLVHYGEPISIKSTKDILKQKIMSLSARSWEEYIKEFNSIDEEFLNIAKSNLFKKIVPNENITYLKALTLSIYISKLIKIKEDNIALLLPTISTSGFFNIATLIAGKCAVNLNYTANEESIIYAIKEANLKTLWTSKKFISKLKSKLDIDKILNEFDNIYYLEDLKDKIDKKEFIKLLIEILITPKNILKNKYFNKNNLNKPAFILFSSGSEGKPKGIVLSHKNILANTKGVLDILNPTKDDVVLSSLPIFHAFGLSVTTIMPLISNIKVVFSPDPTNALEIAKVVAKNKVTIMCATSTFLRLYTKNKKVPKEAFNTIRFTIAGAEKLNNLVEKEFKDKFTKDIYEGYGATETSPVISANIPNILDSTYWSIQLGYKKGSVGMPIPGISIKIIDPDTNKELKINEAGLLIVSGASVMSGYLDKTKTKEAFIEIDNQLWYKTGDKCIIDEDGFITIVDRYSRFAKIGGEMISLSSVENILNPILEDKNFICVNLPDNKKGEKIVLVLEEEIKDIKEKLKSLKTNPLYIPSDVIVIDKIPMLGSGKKDFKSTKNILLNK